MSNLKAKLSCSELTIGSWITLAHPGIAEIMADSGFDWLVIDLEHSVITIKETEELIRAINLRNIPALVRVTSNDPGQIKRVMDAGASGVVVPMIRNREQAESAVRAVKYPPQGTRGVGLARAQNYGFSVEEYFFSANRNSIVIAQIEHFDAIRNIEEILSVYGIDGTIIGPYDLSGSMGKPGMFDEDDVKKALEQYERVSMRMNKPAGFHVVPPDHSLIIEKIKMNYKFIAFSTDFLFLGTKCKEQMRELKRGH